MKRSIVTIITMLTLGLIPATASATTSTDVCVSKLPFVSLVTPLSGACGTEASLVEFDEEGPAGPTGPTGPKGAEGETGAQGPKGETGAPGSLIIARIRLAEPISVSTSGKVTLPLVTSSWTQGAEEMNQMFQSGGPGPKAIARTTNPSCTQPTQKLNIEEKLTPAANNNESGPIVFWFETGSSQSHTITLKVGGSYCENSKHEAIEDTAEIESIEPIDIIGIK